MRQGNWLKKQNDHTRTKRGNHKPVWGITTKLLLIYITTEQFDVATTTVKFLFMLHRKLKH